MRPHLTLCFALLSTPALAFAHPPLHVLARQSALSLQVARSRLRVAREPRAQASADAERPKDELVAAAASPATGIPPWLLALAVFAHVLANSLLAQAVPTAMLGAMGNDRVRTAHALGRLSAFGGAPRAAQLELVARPSLPTQAWCAPVCRLTEAARVCGACVCLPRSLFAAMLDIVVAPQLGRLSDSIGRKPLLLALPCVALGLRSAAATTPTIVVLVGVKAMSACISSGFMVSLRAALADQYR